MAHECLIEYCAKKVDDHLAICSDHYRILPLDMSAEIRRGYGAGMTRETGSVGLMRSLHRANAWIQERFGIARKEHDPGKWERLCRTIREKDAARIALREHLAANPEPEQATPFRHPRLDQ